jgi:hypothetical protein
VVRDKATAILAEVAGYLEKVSSPSPDMHRSGATDPYAVAIR